jgi:hypothetical protein
MLCEHFEAEFFMDLHVLFFENHTFCGFNITNIEAPSRNGAYSIT